MNQNGDPPQQKLLNLAVSPFQYMVNGDVMLKALLASFTMLQICRAPEPILMTVRTLFALGKFLGSSRSSSPTFLHGEQNLEVLDSVAIVFLTIRLV